MNRQSDNNSGVRLTGIDLLRVLAAYGVVLIHLMPKDRLCEVIGGAMRNTCVPFFYAAAFYFAVRPSALEAGRQALTARLRRLVVPYCAWTAIYLAARFLKHLHEASTPSGFILDPVSVLFFGGAALHLYFLPNLIVGTLLCGALRSLLRGLLTRPIAALALAAASLWLNVYHSGGSSDAGRLDGLGRFVQLTCASVLTVLPYIFFGVFIHDLRVRALLLARPKWTFLAASGVVVGLNAAYACGCLWFPDAVVLLVIGCAGLVSGLALSEFLVLTPMVRTAADYSLGIYLVHHLLIEGIEALDKRLAGQAFSVYTLPTFAGVSLVVFGLSYAVTAVISRQPLLRELLLGKKLISSLNHRS